MSESVSDLPRLVFGGVVFIFGFAVGALYAKTSGTQTRSRRGEQRSAGLRDSEALARAPAFDDRYQNYGNPLGVNYLPKEDLDDVIEMVKKRLASRLGNYDLLYQQAGLSYEGSIDTPAETGVAQASALF